MKTIEMMAPVGPVAGLGWPVGARVGEESWGGGGKFGCPVCGVGLGWSGVGGERVVTCGGCGAAVVVPQPELGCRAMRYRDWLRLQEMDGEVAMLDPVVAARPLARRGEVRREDLGRWRAEWRWLAGGGLVMVVVVAGVVVMGVASSGRRDGEDILVAGAAAERGTTTAWATPVLAGTVLAGDKGLLANDDDPVMTAAGAALGAADDHDGPSVTGAAVRSGGRLLEAVVRGAGEEAVRALAERSRSFAASAPPDEAYWCVKLSDPEEPEHALRAYGPHNGGLDQVIARLEWGSGRPVEVQLRWHGDGGEVGGYWLVESLALVETDDHPRRPISP